MATFLEVGILNYFSIIFPALLVFVIIFAILEKTKLLGENKSLHAIVAIVSAFLTMISTDIAAVINFGAPWFIMVFVFLTLMLLIYRFMGASEADLAAAAKEKTVAWTIFAVSIIIVISSISHVYGQKLLERSAGEADLATGEAGERAIAAGDDTFRSELLDALFNPKVLGLMFIFLVAVFTVSLLTRT